MVKEKMKGLFGDRTEQKKSKKNYLNLQKYDAYESLL